MLDRDSSYTDSESLHLLIFSGPDCLSEHCTGDGRKETASYGPVTRTSGTLNYTGDDGSFVLAQLGLTHAVSCEIFTISATNGCCSRSLCNVLRLNFLCRNVIFAKAKSAVNRRYSY